MVVRLMARVPSVPKRKPDLLDEAETLVWPAARVEVEDQAWSRHFLNELDCKADEFENR